MRRLPTLTLLLGLTLLAPSAAQANRGYGAFEPYEDLAVVQTSDDGRELRSLTLRVQMACDDDRTYGWVADVKAARGALSPSTRGRNRLVVKRGSLHGSSSVGSAIAATTPSTPGGSSCPTCARTPPA